jgi:type II secretory pathway pseudopilin PulG
MSGAAVSGQSVADKDKEKAEIQRGNCFLSARRNWSIMTIKLEIKQRAISPRSGFAIIEASVATAIVGIVFAALLSGFTGGFGIIRLARENVRATQIIQEKMEMIRLYNWDQINSNGFIPTNFTASFDPTNSSKGLIYRGTVVVTMPTMTEGYSNTIRQATVEVAWVSGNTQRNRKMTTLVSRYGLQNYIY